MEDLDELLSDKMKGKPLKRMCDKTTDLVNECYKGIGPRFVGDVALCVSVELGTRQDSSALNDEFGDSDDQAKTKPEMEALYALTLLLDDGKEFLKKLKLSTEAAKSARSASADSDDRKEEKAAEATAEEAVPLENAYEMTVAKIIVMLSPSPMRREFFLAVSDQNPTKIK